jgi:hypothetical protein
MAYRDFFRAHRIADVLDPAHLSAMKLAIFRLPVPCQILNTAAGGKFS